MGMAKNMAKNTAVLLIAQIISAIMGLFYLLITANYLGDSGFGTLSFALAITGMFGVFADIGLCTLATREISRDRSIASKYLGNALIVKLILSILTIIAISITVYILGYTGSSVMVVFAIALSTILMSFASIFNSVFQAYGNMKYQAFGQLINSTIMLFGVIFAVHQGYGVVLFAWVYGISACIVVAYSLGICMYRFAIPRIEVDLKFLKSTLKDALPYGLSGLFVTIFYWISSVMLSYMHGDQAVGWYNGAYRLILFILFIPTVMNIVIFPAMSQLYVSSTELLRLMTEKYFKYMAMIAIPMGIGTTLLASNIILTLFKPEYTNSIIVLQILIWSAVFIFIGSAFARLLESSNRQMTVTMITLICMIVNVVLNLILIPRYSYIGASVTTVVTELLSLMLCMYASLRIYNNFFTDSLEILTKVIVSGIIMAVFIIVFSGFVSGLAGLILTVLLSALLYFGVLYALKGFDENDFVIFRSIIEKRISSSK
jgi:O-antigen/teichoic acid export membrane protein